MIMSIQEEKVAVSFEIDREAYCLAEPHFQLLSGSDEVAEWREIQQSEFTAVTTLPMERLLISQKNRILPDPALMRQNPIKWPPFVY
jgi:hypothetical protein